MNPTPSDVTRLLSAWAKGDDGALEQLVPLIYDELRRVARAHWRNQPAGHTLQPTALVHEAFLKLIDQRNKPYENRAHFFAVSSAAMRQVLVTYAKASQTQKRGSGAVRPLAKADLAEQKDAREILALNDALNRLEEVDARKSRVVELRFFGGLNTDEIAAALKISPITVSRDWRVARAWLAREISRDNAVFL